jgi:hypothetical protein
MAVIATVPILPGAANAAIILAAIRSMRGRGQA